MAYTYIYICTYVYVYGASKILALETLKSLASCLLLPLDSPRQVKGPLVS